MRPCASSDLDFARACRRYIDISTSKTDSELRGNKLKQQHRKLEYCVHGQWLMSDTDEKGRAGTWWVPVKQMLHNLKGVGRARAKQAIEEFESELVSDRQCHMDMAHARIGLR